MEKVKNKHEQKYLRMTLNERIQHFLLLSSFITLVITGFALKYPEAVWVMWTRKLFSDYIFEIRGIVHRVAAVIMIADSLYHIFYVSFTKRGRKLIIDLWFYKKDLTDLPVILPPEPASNTTHALHLFIIMIDTEKTKVTRDELISRLHRKNIGTGVHYIALHLQPYYREMYGHRRGDFPNADFISERTLSIPFSAKLTDEDVGDVIVALKEILE